ncbi:MAG: glycine oxidase ThiO [Chloroherpetonaceae bacterium]
MNQTLPKKCDVVIVGGGIIGLSIGWQLLRRGIEVTLIEKGEAGKAASWLAAGMLAPNAEVGFEEINFLKFGEKSLSLYPMFLDELREDSGIAVPLDECGTLMIALDRDDREYLKRLYDFRKSLKLPAEWLSGIEARNLEPMLSPKVVSGLWLTNDAQIDNRLLVSALKQAFLNKGGTLIEQCPVHSVDVSANTLQTEIGAIQFSRLVLAIGCWSRHIDGIPDEHLPPVRPVKGQILTLQMSQDLTLSKVIRSPRVYLAPKHDGRLVVGATSEERGFDESITAGGVLDLLQEGYEAVPAIYEMTLQEVRVGLRPASRDNEPILGESPYPNIFYATGHYRHGILLAPITALEMSNYLLNGVFSDEAKPFLASRFFHHEHLIRHEP